jgi:hypothetical protein
MQHIAELVRFCAAFREIGSIGVAQGADQGVPMLSADFAILIAVALESHKVLHSFVCFENLAERE